MSVGIHRVGVVGAGTMGNGIAQVFAAAGYPVTMRDLGAEFLNWGRPSPLLKQMCHAGYLGRKKGRGFFTYAAA